MSNSTALVRLAPSGRSFRTEVGRTILESGLSAGIALPFGCANGSCGECRARVIDGEVESARFHDYPLSEADRIAGVRLLCSSVAVSDLTIEVEDATAVENIAPQSLIAKLCRTESRGDVTLIAFKFIRAKAFRFLSGQSVELEFEGGLVGVFPLASCPCNAQFVEFHLPRRNPEAAAVLELLSASDGRARVTVRGPLGQFAAGPEFSRPKILIATGEGFASIQGLMEHFINLEVESECVLIWQSTAMVSRYLDNLCRSWSDAFDNVSFIPLESDDDIMDQLVSLEDALVSEAEIYLSGMTDEAADGLVNAVRERWGNDNVRVNRAVTNA